VVTMLIMMMWLQDWRSRYQYYNRQHESS
jgi:hypothetical protein